MTPSPARYEERLQDSGWVVFDTFTQTPVVTLSPVPLTKAAAISAASRLNRAYAMATSQNGA